MKISYTKTIGWSRHRAQVTRFSWLDIVSRDEYPRTRGIVLFRRLMLCIEKRGAGDVMIIWRKVERTDYPMTADPTLRCPSCSYSAPLSEFVPPRLSDRFERVAFVTLTVVCVLSVLRGLGFLGIPRMWYNTHA